MINETIKSSLQNAMEQLGIMPIPSNINMERPSNRDHGDWSSNLALVISKKVGRQAREIADEISEFLNTDLPEGVEEVTTAGPGFINFKVSRSCLFEVLLEVLERGSENYGKLPKVGRKVNIEFVSANPTGPLHAGHARGACYGDAIANLLSFVGFDVYREFYMNDRGTQMQIFGESLLARQRGDEVPEGGYGGEYILDWAAVMPEGLDLHEVTEWGCAYAQKDQKETLAKLGIHFDTWFSEKSMIDNGGIEQALNDLAENGSAYEKDGATWLASTSFGAVSYTHLTLPTKA